jgi:DNA-binding transcriptional LysR family regulator
MDLRQLECFVVVAEELHFGHAAERLHMTQPPLSRQIRLLEDHLGVELFVRAHNKVKLTAAGRALLIEARDLLSRTAQARERVRKVGDGETGSVTLGFTAGSAYALMPSILAKASEVLPEVRIHLVEQPSVALIERLREGQVDLALVRKVPADQELEQHLLQRETLLAALPSNHPLASAESIAPALFNDQPFIAYSESEGQHFHELIGQAFERHGVRPRYVQHVGQTDALLGLIRIGLGIGIVPSSVSDLQPPGIVFKPIDMPPVHAAMWVAWRKQNGNPVLRRLLDGVIDLARFS